MKSDPLEKYVDLVINKKIKTSKTTLQAVKRHLKDLERSQSEDFEWRYDVKKAKHAVDFMELLPEPKTGRPQPLANFQKFIVGSIYGWVSKDDPTVRRFRNVFISMARKNGKSLLISGIVLFEFLFGKNPRRKRQEFTAANDKKQAGIVFEMVKERLESLRRQDESVRAITRVKQAEIINLKDGSEIRSFSREAGLVNGYEPHVAVVDEYADANDTKMIDTLKTGQILLNSFLTIIISTASFNLNAPMYKNDYPFVKKLLAGEVTSDRYFAFIAEQESVEEVENEENWIKSNPLLEVPELRKQIVDYLKEESKTAKEQGKYNGILVKNFNIWRQTGENSYMDVGNWNNSLQKLKPDIKGKRTWIGIDAGKTSDLFSISWFTLMEGYWWLDSYSFIGSKYGIDAKIKSDRMDYRFLQDKGDCEITQLESGVIDNERAFEWLNEFVEKNKLIVEGIAFDRAGFGLLMSFIEKNRPEWPLIQVAQGTISLSEPTKQFRDDILESKIKHSDNEILRTAAMNAITKVDNNGLRIDKNRNSNKIDAMDAALDAYSVCFTENVDAFANNEYIMSDDFGF